MAEGGPTEQELAAAKKYVIGSYAINNLDSSGAIAGTLLELQLQGLGIDYMERRTDYLGAVTLGEVKAVATKLLSAKPAIMVVGPALKDKDAGGGKG
jgi:zinc protease